MAERIIIEMTPFIYEDGNTYYFQIFKRPSTHEFHDLFVYEKVSQKKFFGGIKYVYNQLNSSPELIDNQLKSNEIKNKIIRILTGTKAKNQINGWDGFVGNISESTKKAFGRESKLNDLLK